MHRPVFTVTSRSVYHMIILIAPRAVEMEVFMIKDNNRYCVYKASPSGIQKPVYYGSEKDCRRFCEEKDYEYIDEKEVVWYLEISSCKEEQQDTCAGANVSVSA